MASDGITCPECGETITSEDHVHTEEVRTVETTEDRGLRFGSASENLYRCKKCRAILGVRRTPTE